MKVAAIDVGTNSTRLMVAQVTLEMDKMTDGITENIQKPHIKYRFRILELFKKTLNHNG